MEHKRQALGRGLEQLFSTEVLDFDAFEDKIMESADENDIKEIPLSEIRPNPYQPRKSFDQAALDELATSIKNYGVFQPIIVKKSIKGYDLVAGERRLRASKLAGLDTIPAIVKEFDDEQMREIALLENIQRENLSSIELAWAYKGIIDSLQIRQEDLAARIGKSRSHVTNILGLLRLPDDVQDMVRDNKISMGHARVLSKIEDNAEVEKLAKDVVKNNISVRDLENISQKEDGIRKVSNTKQVKDNEYKYVEDELKDILGTKVRVENKKIEIFFNSKVDLTRILDILNVKID